jgi:hypothetical protein
VSNYETMEETVQVWLPARTVERIRELADDRELHATGVPIAVDLFCEMNPVPIERGDWAACRSGSPKFGLVVDVCNESGALAALSLWNGGEMRLKVARIGRWDRCDPPQDLATRNRLLRAAGLEEVCAWD